MADTLRLAHCRFRTGAGAQGAGLGAGLLGVDALSAEVRALTSLSVESLAHSFQREFELIAKYGDLMEESSKKSTSKGEVALAVPPQSSPAAQVAAEVHVHVMAPAVDGREASVVAMMERTGEERDACFFYLESMDWHLEAAVELFQSMASR